MTPVEPSKTDDSQVPPAGVPPTGPPIADLPAANRKKAGAAFAAYPVTFPRLGRPETTIGRSASSWPRR